MSSDPGDPVLPTWFERALAAVVVVLVACGGVGLFLADRGWFTATATLAPALPGAAIVLALAWRRLRATRGAAQAHLPAAVAVAVALASAVVQGRYAGRWITTDRDPGVYGSTAMWLVHQPSLAVPVAPDWARVGLGVTGASSGAFDIDGTVEFQFSHLGPVLMGLAGRLFGVPAAFVGTAVVGAVGLLAVFAVAARVSGRPWLAVLVTVALGFGLPWVYATRTSLSEVVTLTLVWSGVWLLQLAWERRSLWLVTVGSLVLCTSFGTRVDALFYVALLPVLAALATWWLGAADRRWLARAVPCALAGAVLPVGVGLLDLFTRTGTYVEDQAAQFDMLVKLTAVLAVLAVVVVLAGVVVRRRTGDDDPTRAAPSRWRTLAGALPAVAGGAVLVVGALGWAVRPFAGEARLATPVPLVAAAQRGDGIAADGIRSFDEQTLVWISWYVGPVLLAAGLVGVALAVHRALRGRADLAVLLAVTGLGAAAYLWRASIVPDQPWASRRMLVAAVPLVLVCAAFAFRYLERWVPRHARPVVAVGMALACTFPLATASPLFRFSPRASQLDVVEQTCATLGPDAAVLVPGRTIGAVVLLSGVRGVCQVPVASPTDPVDPAVLRRTAAGWAARGRQLWVLDASLTLGAEPPAGAGTVIARAVRGQFVGATLIRPPSTLSTESLTVWGYPVAS